MKNGDYLVAKMNGDRTVWDITRDQFGKIINSKVLYSFEFKKGEKFLISGIDNSVVKIETKSGYVRFSISKEKNHYEHYTDIFYDFDLARRKAKLIRLNEISECI